MPLETLLAGTPGVFHADEAAPCWRVYHAMAERVLKHRLLRKTHPMVAVTEHRIDESRWIAVVINQSPKPVRETLSLAPGWRLERVLHGTAEAPADAGMLIVPLANHQGCVLELAHAPLH